MLSDPTYRAMSSFILVAALLMLPSRPVGAVEATIYESILRDKNIAPTSESLAKYLRELHPSEDQQAKAEQLIAQLGDEDSFQMREQAMKTLLIMPNLPTEKLIAATQGDDPEIRWRSQRVLDIGKPESTKVFHAALRVIAIEQLPNLTPELLAAIPLCDKTHLLRTAGEALDASASEDDAPELRQALTNENAQVRAAALSALGVVLGEDASEDIAPLLEDASDEVKMAAARSLANMGERKSLRALLGLLKSDDLQVRVAASVALRQLTGQHFSFAAYDSAERRTAGHAEWAEWIEKEGEEAELHFPLKKWGGGYLARNMRLAYGHNHKVVELTPDGKEVWSYTGKSVWGAEKLANGNVLVAELQGNRVVEVDPQGKIVWEYAVNNPLNVKPLDNGNILIAMHNGKKAPEVTPDKKSVWEYQTQASCSDVHRLENGNTLIACYGSAVIEVTPDKKVVWEFEERNSYGCQPLENGNVLICCFGEGKVKEVTRDKEVVWEFAEQQPTDCFRLPGGNTLITGNGRFIEVTPDKKVIWEKSGNSYGVARK